MMNETSTAEQTIRRAMIDAVEGAQGLKATEMAAIVAAEIGVTAVDGPFAETLDALIREGEIVEVEYTVPDLPYRVKSFLLPKGARVLATS